MQGDDEGVVSSMPRNSTAKPGTIRVGVGGWLYAPWRGVFYPQGLKQADELAYAASKLSAIEINATHYRLQNAKTFRKWADATPETFVFSVKGPRIVTNAKALAETGNFVQRFLASGLAELGQKLGPILWQLPPYKRFNADDMAAFLALLPRALDGIKLDHVVEVRHASFATPEFAALLREHGASAVYTDAEGWPSIADATGDVTYARLQRGDDALPCAYPPASLDDWATRARTLASGDVPDDLPRLDATHRAETKPRDVFIYFIHEGKLRAPAAAMALIERLPAA
jgi:uncharacterized protein YecE (DUF72 family)